MYAQFYLSMLVFGIFATILVLLIGSTHRNNETRTYFMLLMGLILYWLIVQLMYVTVSDHQMKYVLNELKFLAVIFLPLILRMVVIKMFRIGHTRLFNIILAFVGAYFLLLIATNPSHWLFRYDIRYILFGPYEILISRYNIGFWLMTTYIYGVMITAVYLLVLMMFKGSRTQREQSQIFLVATLVPTILNAVFILYLKFDSEDLTPLGFTFSGVLFLYGLFYHKLLNVMKSSRRIILSQIDDTIIICDVEGSILDMNPPAMRLLPEAKIGQALKPHLQERFGEPVRDQIYRLRSDEGESKIFNTIEKHPISRGGREVGSIYYLRDATEQMLLEEELLIQQQTIAKDLAEKEAYIHYLMRETRDHVFRLDSLLLQGTVRVPDLKKIADHAIVLLKDQIINIESYMNFEKGQMQVDSIPCMIHAELIRYFDMIQYEAQKKGLKFVLDIESLPEKGNLDMPKLKQVLTNVLMNAIKFTEQGIVKVYVRSNQKEIVFTISDTGRGMTENGLLQVLEPFNQAGGRHALKAGTGIGLLLVHELVRLLGGRMSIESEPGQGTRFNFFVKYGPFEDRIVKEELRLETVQLILSDLDVGLITSDPLFESHLRYQLKEWPKNVFTYFGEDITNRQLMCDIYIVDQSWLEKHLDIFAEMFEFRLEGNMPVVLAAHDSSKSAYLPSGNCHILMKPFMAYDLYHLIVKIL